MAEEHHKHDKKNTLEWSVFTISLLSVISLLAFLTYQTITYNPSSPDLVVEYKHDPSQNAPHRYHITIRNKGQETAEEVQIELIFGEKWPGAGKGNNANSLCPTGIEARRLGKLFKRSSQSRYFVFQSC